MNALTHNTPGCARNGSSGPARVILRLGAALLATFVLLLTGRLAAAPLATLQYRVTGAGLQVTPLSVSVPKSIPGSVMVSVVAGGSTNNAAAAQLSAGAYVQAVLRGPAFPQPYVLQGLPNQPLVFPPISLVGSYELDDIKLVDAVTGATRLTGSPSSVPVSVFDQILISSVTSTPLTIDQIHQSGIYIDEQNFSAVEFEVQFVLNGNTIPVNFPVVSPKFTQPTELIPADQLESSLKKAASLNQQIASTVELPPELQTANLNIQVQGINFQEVDAGTGPQNLTLAIPPIPALMVIPGNIGFLHQFFNVQILTENGAPGGSGLVVSNIQAQLILPPGPDGILSTNYSQPGDDPLRMARFSPTDLDSTTQNVVNPGPDGQLGTGDDINWLSPGQSGEGQFYVEGLQEGLAVMNLNLTAQLYGLANGPVTVKGIAAGSVLVRNPKFSLAFSSPATVRAGEPYQASVTVLNTGVTPANLLSVTLNGNSISGAVLAPGQAQTVGLGTLQPGQSATATFNLISERTGAVEFSNLSTSDDSTVGRFRLSMAVDAEGVALSPDSLALPDYVNNLPTNLLAAANRVLGQALSIATAGQLPPGVLGISSSVVTARALELAEAGERLGYGDPLNRVLPDLLRDWQGGRQADNGFDQLLRQTDAGAAWTAAMAAAMDGADNLTGSDRLFTHAPDMAGLGQNFVVASAGPGQLRVDFTGSTNAATTDGSTRPYALVYGRSNGVWAVTQDDTNAVFTWSFTNAPSSADMAVVIFDGTGHAHSFRWNVINPPPTALYHFALGDPTGTLQVDAAGNGTITSTLGAAQTTINELPPTIIAVQQDLTVLAGRPSPACVGPDYKNYGTVVAVVYSKPVTQQTAGMAASYTLDGNNGADSAQIQPNGRVALLNLIKGISAIIPRTLTISNVTDVDGNPLVGGVKPIQCFYPGTTVPFTGGVAVTGRVLRADGTPAAGIPVTLTMYDGLATDTGCEQVVVRVSQVLTDSGGAFNFDYVMSGIPYSISATDTEGISGTALATLMGSTISGGPDDQLLQSLANSSPAAASALVAIFGVDTVPQAIQEVDGLDRVALNDVVAIGSGREGQTVPFALHFRGRGTVSGQVVAADGVTPLAQAAVNIYPDPTSLEMPRGIYSDANGQFAFLGVPLGNFSISAATSDGRQRTVAGFIGTPGEQTNMLIALPSVPMPFGTLAGQVFEADNVTPNANATVYVGHGSGLQISGVVAIAQADNSGYWTATNVPIQGQAYDLVAVTFDGSRKGERSGITPVANAVTYANITLEAATSVYGRVQFANGLPATNALVAGGSQLVRSDANGNFQLNGVPVGNRTFSAGVEANPALGINFPRLGSASANIVEGQANYVVITLRPAGEIYGRVFDADGDPVPNIEVGIPQQGGFYWTTADANGNYVFENLAPGTYSLSAPANPTAPTLNQSQLSAQLSSGDEDQILAAYGEAVNVFVGGQDPLITGADQDYRPSSWGYNTATIRFDGDTAQADIHFLPLGTVSGTVLNDQGVPIGARVELTGLGPDPTGLPSVTILGEADTDPATGTFLFPHELFPGTWQVQAASPFYPEVISQNGYATQIAPDATNVVLQFPPLKDTNGRIAGHVYYPDGTPVGQGTAVAINISSDYQIQTDTNGFFDTQIEVPAVGITYTVQAFDSISGLNGIAAVAMRPGITNFVDVHLLSRSTTVTVTVLQASGAPAAGAQIELDQGTYPNEAPLTGKANAQGQLTFTTLWQGSYSTTARFTEGSTSLSGRAGGSVGPNQTLNLTVTLGATGFVQGTFVASGVPTPINGAEVMIGNLGFSSTDTNGYFSFDGVPLGTYTVSSMDPVTGGNARAQVTISANGQTQNVQLVEAALGDIGGYVIDSYGTGHAAGASVVVSFNDGFTPSRTVTTGPDGSFDFPGSPLGSFNLNVNFNLADGGGMVSGSGSGNISPTSPIANVQIKLQTLGILPVLVVRDDGVTPATNATVVLASLQQDVDTNGRVLFRDLKLGGYSVEAFSRTTQEANNGAVTNVNITVQGTNPVLVVTLPGTGVVQGTLFGSDGVTPVVNGQITIQFQSGLFSGGSITAISDGQGRFSFSDVPVGNYRITAENLALAASLNGALAGPNQTNTVSLRLAGSGTVTGTIVRQDGVTPVGSQDVVITFASETANQGVAVYFTANDGHFEFDDVPLGSFHLSSVATSLGGIISEDFALTNNQQVLDLGLVAYDETIPAVAQVTPTNNSIGVPITNIVQLVFNEALASNTVTPGGIFIQGTNNNPLPATVSLLADSNGVYRIVNIVPKSPLQSLQTYAVVVLSGDVQGPGNTLIGAGPQDLVGRETAAPFVSHFTTADNTPPLLLSIFPSNNAVQIDPASVPRLAFNKTLQPSGFVMKLTGPQGLVAGSAAVGVNNQVLSFTPSQNLQPNAVYTLTVSNVYDLAGNAAVGQPYISTFSTLDTIGPVITNLQIVTGGLPVAGTTVLVEADLGGNETNAEVTFTQDFNPLGTATNAPYRIGVPLPATGSTTIRALAVDQYGNDGQFVTLTITVQANQPPSVQFTQVQPGSGPATNGATIVVNVTATDDSAVSELQGIVGGAGLAALVQTNFAQPTNFAQLQVAGIVPANAIAGQSVIVFGEATDNKGASSGYKTFSIPVSDTTPPALAILSPTNNGHLAPAPTFNFAAVVSDNSSNVTLNLSITGALTVTQSVALAVAPNQPLTNIIAVPIANPPTNGGSIIATLTATDLASNTTSVVRTFWLANTPGPGISALTIASNLPPIGGLTVPIQAMLAANAPGTTVRFTQDSVLVGWRRMRPTRF